MKTSILQKFATDAINAPAAVTGGGGKCNYGSRSKSKCGTKSKSNNRCGTKSKSNNKCKTKSKSYDKCY